MWLKFLRKLEQAPGKGDADWGQSRKTLNILGKNGVRSCRQSTSTLLTFGEACLVVGSGQGGQEGLGCSGEGENPGRKQLQNEVALWAGKIVFKGCWSASHSLKNANRAKEGRRQSMRAEVRPSKPDEPK